MNSIKNAVCNSVTRIVRRNVQSQSQNQTSTRTPVVSLVGVVVQVPSTTAGVGNGKPVI